MPTYRIYWKGYYREHSEFPHVDIAARSKLSALRKFFEEIRSELEEDDSLEGSDLPDPRTLRVDGEYKWWQDEWLHDYRGIEEVDAVLCPWCEGSGEVTQAVGREFGKQAAPTA